MTQSVCPPGDSQSPRQCALHLRFIITRPRIASYSVSIGHVLEPCKNGWTNQFAVWGTDSLGFKEPCVRYGVEIPLGKRQFWGLSGPLESIVAFFVSHCCIVKVSHTRYRALGPELIPVYRQSACMAISHLRGGRLPLLSARPAVTFPTAEHHRP